MRFSLHWTPRNIVRWRNSARKSPILELRTCISKICKQISSASFILTVIQWALSIADQFPSLQCQVTRTFYRRSFWNQSFVFNKPSFRQSTISNNGETAANMRKLTVLLTHRTKRRKDITAWLLNCMIRHLYTALHASKPPPILSWTNFVSVYNWVMSTVKTKHIRNPLSLLCSDPLPGLVVEYAELSS